MELARRATDRLRRRLCRRASASTSASAVGDTSAKLPGRRRTLREALAGLGRRCSGALSALKSACRRSRAAGGISTLDVGSTERPERKSWRQRSLRCRWCARRPKLLRAKGSGCGASAADAAAGCPGDIGGAGAVLPATKSRNVDQVCSRRRNTAALAVVLLVVVDLASTLLAVAHERGLVGRSWRRDGAFVCARLPALVGLSKVAGAATLGFLGLQRLRRLRSSSSAVSGPSAVAAAAAAAATAAGAARLQAARSPAAAAAQGPVRTRRKISSPRRLGLTEKVTTAMGDECSSWRFRLGHFLERRGVLLLTLVLVAADVLCTVILWLVEGTPLLNPALPLEKVAEFARNVGRGSLSLIVVEQAFQLLSFGRTLFRKPWMVLDLIVVAYKVASEVAEVYGSTGAHLHVGRMAMVLRLWKSFAFLFDVFEARHLREEISEAELKEETAAEPSAAASSSSTSAKF
eukprot:TRINITY_DN30921_c0_g1_i1.p1 TRINITY_DN30921_c0_g1~~TRINITY_DN30921_c0_g1_i1.p1  ORF type:complete len:517 (+),score=99.29 TRINITY_DN30921_c0_g1_i1:164-1552(+)